jgi:hypothetical protein
MFGTNLLPTSSGKNVLKLCGLIPHISLELLPFPLQLCNHSVHRNASNKHFELTDTADRDLEDSTTKPGGQMLVAVPGKVGWHV